jgi:hypothetical protein
MVLLLHESHPAIIVDMVIRGQKLVGESRDLEKVKFASVQVLDYPYDATSLGAWSHLASMAGTLRFFASGFFVAVSNLANF